MEFSFDNVINNVINNLADDNIDFIATVTSNWHAIGVDAFLFDLYKKEKRKLKGIIIINYHVKSGLCLNETDFVCTKFSQVKFFHLKNPKFNFRESLRGFINILMSKFKDKKQLYIISVIEPSFSSFRYFKNNSISKYYDPIYVLIDEGFGTYASNKAIKLAIVQESNKFNFQPIIIMIYLIKTILSYFKKFFFNLFQVERRFIFNKKSNNLIPNQNIIETYKSVLDIRNKNLKIQLDVKNEKFVILATSPILEYNKISLDMEISIIKAITAIARKNGITTVIKSHPRELEDKYSHLDGHDVQIINKNFSLEDLLVGLDPICIIGYASTALVNAKIFYGIDALNISEIAYKKSRNMTLKKETIDFKILTSDFILQISEFSQINDYLNSAF